MSIRIRQATLSDLDILIPLFDGYRLFYRQASDPLGARQFLHDRLIAKESVIYIALSQDPPNGLKSTESELTKVKTGKGLGFTQLYPIFSSVSMERMLLLNDLFIDPKYRGQGIGKALIETCKDLCRTTGQKGIVLQTETNNPAQRLYEREGFTKDPDLHYFWKCNAEV